MEEILYLIILVLYLCVFTVCYQIRSLADSVELSDIEAGVESPESLE